MEAFLFEISHFIITPAISKLIISLCFWFKRFIVARDSLDMRCVHILAVPKWSRSRTHKKLATFLVAPRLVRREGGMSEHMENRELFDLVLAMKEEEKAKAEEKAARKQEARQRKRRNAAARKQAAKAAAEETAREESAGGEPVE